MVTKVQWLCWKVHDNCVAYFRISLILQKSSNIRKPIRCVHFTKAVVRHANIRDQNPSLGMICPGDLISVTPMLQNLRIGLRKRRNGKSDVPVKQCCRLRSVDTHDQQKGLEFCWNGHFDDVEKSYDSLNRRMKRPQFTSKKLDKVLTMKVLEDRSAVLLLGKLCDEHGYSYEGINGQKPHLIKNGIRIQCNTENFVPIVVPGLSTSSSSSFPSSTCMTSSRHEIDHRTCSSSSSISPTMTSSTVSSDSVIRRARGDLAWDRFQSSNCVK